MIGRPWALTLVAQKAGENLLKESIQIYVLAFTIANLNLCCLCFVIYTTQIK